jgi:hypothetical protein
MADRHHVGPTSFLAPGSRGKNVSQYSSGTGVASQCRSPNVPRGHLGYLEALTS